MFQSYAPNYTQRKNEFEKNEITEETILVWYSCGWWFIIRRLSENSETYVGKVLLIAPWLDPSNTKLNDFFDFTIDTDLLSRTQWVTVFSSTNDSEDVQQSIDDLTNKISWVRVREFKQYGHFCLSDLGT
jgi:hypothetical protein